MTIKQRDGTAAEVVATFDDTEWRILEEYLDCVDALFETKLAQEGVPCESELNIREGRLVRATAQVPTSEELAALLHRLRPFVLQEEETSFVRITGLLAKKFDHSTVRRVMKEQRELFDGTNAQELVRIGSATTIVNSEKTLKDWLYGFEYHRDPEKRARIKAIERAIPAELTRPTFIGLLGDKVQAVYQIAGFIAVVLGRQPEIQA